MARLIVVRHGQASYGADVYDELSALGVEQSAQLGRWFAECDLKPARIVSGSLKRHRQTAQHCLAALGDGRAPPPADWLVDPSLDEFDNEHVLAVFRPDLATPAAVRAHLAAHPDPMRESRELFFASIDRWVACDIAGGYRELWSEFHSRSHDGLLRAAEGLVDDEAALVFTSGGVISALCHRLLGLAPRVTFELNWSLANTGVTVLQARKGRLRLASLNGVAHLEQARQTEWITYR